MSFKLIVVALLAASIARAQNVPDAAKVPTIEVKNECTDNACKTCADQKVTYKADGTCVQMPQMMPEMSTKRRQRAQEGTEGQPQEAPVPPKSYKADCNALTVTFYTDDNCKTKATEDAETKYPNTCTAEETTSDKKYIASCINPPAGGSVDDKPTTAAPVKDGTTAAPVKDGTTAAPVKDGTTAAPVKDGTTAAGDGIADTTNNENGNTGDSEDGVSVQSLGAVAVALLMTALLC